MRSEPPPHAPAAKRGQASLSPGRSGKEGWGAHPQSPASLPSDPILELEARVEEVAQAIAEEVDRQNGEHQREARKG